MGKKGSKRKTRWRVLPIGGEDGCNGVCSNNEDELDGDRDSSSPLNNATASGKSYARASAQRMPRTKPSTTSSRGGSYNYRHRSYYQQPHENPQPLVTTEKKTFNEEEYTKITTPRQDVLFKKGYLGRKRSTAASTADTTANVNNSYTNNGNTETDVANGNFSIEGTVDQNGEVLDNDHNTNSDVMSPVEEQSQYIYATNGFVEQTGAPPPGLYYINGSGYELYDPYCGNVTVVVGPAPHYGGPGGGPPVLAAVPCQPLPLQPLEWFNPAFLPYITAPCHNGLATTRDRTKRYSTDSQNCSPQSSESTEPPGSPQECEMEVTQPGEPAGPAVYTQTPAYVYPGYMFGPPMYNVNGVTVQGAPTQLPSCDIAGSNKRRKKKRRRRRRRGRTEDGCSEESSSDEKELEEPMSVTSQESSSQEIESDSKQSTNTTTLNNDSSSSSPLSSCQTLTPTDLTDTTLRLSTLASETIQQITELKAFSSEISPTQTQSLNNTQQSALVEHIPPSLKHDTKDTCLEQDEGNIKAVVKDKGKQSVQNFSQVSKDLPRDSETSNSIKIVKDQTESDTLDLHSSICTSTNHTLCTSTNHTGNSLVKEEELSLKDCPKRHCAIATYSAINGTSELAFEAKSVKSNINLDTIATEQSPNSYSLNLAGSKAIDTDVQRNGVIISSASSGTNGKIEDTTKNSKQKKSGKQSNVKTKKTSKGKDDKQNKIKSSIGNFNVDADQKKVSKKKDDSKKSVQDSSGITSTCRAVKLSQSFSENATPSEITTENAKSVNAEIYAQKLDTEKEYKESIPDDCQLSLNGLDESGISNVDPEHNEVIMDGNEKNKNQHQFPDLPVQASTMSYSSSSNNGAKKFDLFPEFQTSHEEPPMRPGRREKQKSPPTVFQPSDKNASDVSTKSATIDKLLQLPPISLRPDIPKIQPKVPHEVSLAKQLKGTADILESINVALTSEKSAITTETSKENLLEREIGLDVKKEDSQALAKTVGISVEHQSESNTFKFDHEVLKTAPSTSTQEESGVSVGGNEKILKGGNTEEHLHCEEVHDNFAHPVPPPRSKKLYNMSKQKYIQHKRIPGWDIEGGNVTDESSGDSTSSTTHESEESVIELLSSTHTNPDDRAKQDFSDDEEDIIFRGEKLENKSEMIDIKSVPPDKTDVCTPSISGPSQDSSQIMHQDKTTNRDIMSLDLESYSKETEVSIQHTMIQLLYADELSKIIISEAIQESSKKRTCLPITEAVTRWLRSQSPQILSLPQLENEPESDISSEDQETEESPTEGNKTEDELTGQKNVFCNPLPVPLHEDCNQLLVNSDVNQSDYDNGTGRRVAFNDIQYLKSKNENAALIKNDNNRTDNSLSGNEYNKLTNEHKFVNCKQCRTNNCNISTRCTNKNNVHKDYESEQMMQDFRENVSDLCINECSNDNGSKAKFNCYRTGEIRKQGDVNSQNAEICKVSDFSKISASVTQLTESDRFMKEQKSSEKRPENKNYRKTDEKVKLNLSNEHDEFSFTNEETPECEWDLWDCNPVKPSSVLTVPKSPSPAETVLTKTPDDYCSHMCDPAVSVAKYYSLGTLQIEKVKTGKTDEDEILSYLADSSDEEVDALKHFQHELEDDDGLKTYTSPLFSSLILNSSNTTCNSFNKEDKRRESTYENSKIYRSHYGEASHINSSRFVLENQSSRNVNNTTLSQRAQAAQLFHKKSSIIVSKLKGDGPFPCGGICCILQ